MAQAIPRSIIANDPNANTMPVIITPFDCSFFDLRASTPIIIKPGIIINRHKHTIVNNTYLSSITLHRTEIKNYTQLCLV